MARREIRLELRMQLEVGVAEPVHPDHPAEVIAIQLHQPADRRDAGKHDDGQQRNGDRDKRRPETRNLRDQRQRDHRAGQDGQEDRHPAQRFGVGQRAGCEQAPVFGRQNLQPGGGCSVFAGRRHFG